MPVAQDLRKGDAQVLDWGRANNLSQSHIGDTAKRWSPGQWRRHHVRIRGGLNDCVTVVIRNNSENSLELQSQLPVVPQHADESSYEILTPRADSSDDVILRLQSLEAKVDETNLALRQIRYGIGLLVERDLSQVDADT